MISASNLTGRDRVSPGMLRSQLTPIALIPVCILSVCLTGCVEVDFGPSERFREAFHYSYDLQPGGRVTLENTNGRVEISGWDQNKIEIDGERYASTDAVLKELKIEIRNEPNMIEIRTVRPSDHGFFSNTGATYTIHVPRSARLDRVATTNGRIEVHDMEVGVRLRSTNGKILGERINGGVEAQTSNGGIELRAVQGGLTLKTTNGSINVIANHAPKETLRAETSNGSITLRLPADTVARVEASTSNSGVRSDFDVSGHVRMDRNHMSGDIGKADGTRPLIDLRTSNGHISLLRD